MMAIASLALFAAPAPAVAGATDRNLATQGEMNGSTDLGNGYFPVVLESDNPDNDGGILSKFAAESGGSVQLDFFIRYWNDDSMDETGISYLTTDCFTVAVTDLDGKSYAVRYCDYAPIGR